MFESRFESCLRKQEEVKARFRNCQSIEDRYQMIIDLGRTQNPLPPEDKIDANRVYGCQSNMFLTSRLENGLCIFQSDADALISAGLGVLLTMVYSGETPETVLKCPPQYLEDLQIRASLTPGRANGLASLYLRMKQDAIRLYAIENKN